MSIPFFRRFQRKLRYKSWVIYFLALIVVYLTLVKLAGSLNKWEFGMWQSEIFADKAGYYIYLPATFIHGFYKDTYPKNIEYRLDGFKFIKQKVVTKYTCGVAILSSPFFLISHAAIKLSGAKADGFSTDYLSFTYYASVFYLMLGMIALFLFLRRRFSIIASFLTIILLTFGTNLYYYTFYDPYMSHIYSFAMFAILLYLTDQFWINKKRLTLILLAIVSGFILLLRPSNIIFLSVILFLDISSFRQLKERFLVLISPINLSLFAGLSFLVLLPQMIYWKFISGSFIFYSYKGEGFTNWKQPKIIEVLFSPNNGLIPYTPAFILIIIGIIVLLARKKANRWMVAALFLLHLYIVSSWWVFNYGCSFGQRSFVEFLAITSIPLAGLFKISRKPFNIAWLITLLLIFGYFIFFNLRVTNSYLRCFTGSDWDWKLYKRHLLRAEVLPLPEKNFSWKNDFENPDPDNFSGSPIVKSDHAYSGDYVNAVSDLNRGSKSFNTQLEDIDAGNIYKVKAKIEAFIDSPVKNAVMICQIIKNDSSTYYSSIQLDPKQKSPVKKWTTLEADFIVPFMAPEGKMSIYIFLNDGQDMLIDDFSVNIYSEK